MPITINEGINLLQQLKTRRAELVVIRADSANKTERLYGEKTVMQYPIYSLKEADSMTNEISKEIRKLDTAIKAQNAKTIIEGFEPNENAMRDLVEDGTKK